MNNNLLPSYEIWSFIKGYEGQYEISNRGKVRSWVNSTGSKLKDGSKIKHTKHRKEPIILKCHKNKHGYFQVGLSISDKRRIHREVAIAFNPNPSKLPEVDHVNGKKWCNEWWNFEWVEVLLIYRHKAKTKLIAKGFNISEHCVLDIKRGRTWWHITGHDRHIKPSEKGKYKIDPKKKL